MPCAMLHPVTAVSTSCVAMFTQRNTLRLRSSQKPNGMSSSPSISSVGSREERNCFA